MTKHYKSIMQFNESDETAKLYLDFKTGNSFTVLLSNENQHNIAFRAKSIISIFSKMELDNYTLIMDETNEYLSDLYDAYSQSSTLKNDIHFLNKLEKRIGVEDRRVFIESL